MNKWIYRFGLYGIGLIIGSYMSFYYADSRSETVRLKNGDAVPSINLQDQNGNAFHLDSLKGDYVLIDFWSSYDPVSRANNIQVSELHKQFKDAYLKDSSMIKFVSFGVEENDENWKKIIVEDKKDWINVSDFKSWDSPVLKEYGVTDVPTIFLVNPEGKIISKTLNFDALAFAINQEME